MVKNINKVAIKFIKKCLKGKKTSEAVVDFLEGQGYSVVFYTPEAQIDVLKAHKVLEYSKEFKNFTLRSKNAKSVFILKSQSSEEKYIALLHEAAHIFLGHLYENINTANTRENEAEAEAFVYAVLNQRKGKTPILCCAVALLLICLAVPLSLRQQSATKQTADITVETADEMVYVTSSGDKYHRRECIYTKDKDCAELSKQQAQRTYAPCKVCNP